MKLIVAQIVDSQKANAKNRIVMCLLENHLREGGVLLWLLVDCDCKWVLGFCCCVKGFIVTRGVEVLKEISCIEESKTDRTSWPPKYRKIEIQRNGVVWRFRVPYLRALILFFRYEAIQDAAEAPMGTQDMELLQGIVPDAGLDIFGDSRFGQNQLQGPLSIQGRQQNFSNQGNYELPLYGSGDQMSTLGQGVIAGGPSTFGQAGQLMANQNNFMPNSMLGMSDGSGFANNQSMQSNSSRLYSFTIQLYHN
eukprot:754601-Hanusia_phi.AAC.1